MFKLRILTAAILIPLVFGAIFGLSQPLFALTTALVFGLAAWEWAQLAGWRKMWQRLLYALFILIGISSSLNIEPALIVSLGAFVWLFITAWLVYLRKGEKMPLLPHWAIALIGFFVLLPAWNALVLLHLEPKLLFYMLLMIWITDTGAYLGGRKLGKHKLAPTISPNKTWEGLHVGMVAAFISSIILVWIFFVPGQFDLKWIVPVVPLIAASVVGDLFESALKRTQGLKDTSQLLPGHGGILDRIDSVIAGAPVFACAWIFVHTAMA